jgi:hypothetical protein
MKSKWLLSTLTIFTALAGCENEPVTVGSNTEALEINKVDILFVVDNSYSMEGLRTELPALLESFIAGSDEPGMERPELTDIHLATISTDMGVGGVPDFDGCVGLGDDGLFLELKPEDLAECNSDVINFITYDDGTSEITTELAASCLPSVGTGGCGFEQPLEAMLKALWPAGDSAVEFAEGEGHGGAENDGFLREDSLLIVIVVSDEDDCSASDNSIFEPAFANTGLNTRCATNPDALFDVERYVQGLKDLRAAENDPIVFVALSGVPAELAEAQGDVDLSDAEAVEAYYDEVLDDDAMQIVINTQGTPDVPEDDGIVPSCTKPSDDPNIGEDVSYPPRRLVQVAKAFGSAGVLGSLCGDDFSSAMGGVIRATAEKLP